MNVGSHFLAFFILISLYFLPVKFDDRSVHLKAMAEIIVCHDRGHVSHEDTTRHKAVIHTPSP